MIALLSGGLDSAVAAAMVRGAGPPIRALTFDYGQTHRPELECAAWQAHALDLAGHTVVRLDLRDICPSALTGAATIPTGHAVEEIGREIPVTYVPARNTIFLAYALAVAESGGQTALVFGANLRDRGGYPDCRPAYLEAFEHLANLATKAGVEGARFQVLTPLRDMDKPAILRRGADLGVEFAQTWSCYGGGPRHCGVCDACTLRRWGFREAGLRDPTCYAH